ncbi:DUF4340 domain-containing protein [Halomonas denitrificans]|nr:DUF4340 domain-containing protein [Halomonas denitrificans]
MMMRNRLLLLACATLLAIGLVIWLGAERPVDDESGGPVLAGLAGQINRIDAVDLVAPGEATAVRLRREDERWRVLDRDGYEADFQQVVDLLRTLAEAERSEPKTADPAWYGRLGVTDPADPDATGRRIEFPGTDLVPVIVGQVDPTDSGSYVRSTDEEQAWLADRVIEVALDPVAWLEPGIMDIPADDLVSVTVTHADGETVRLQKVTGPGEGDESGEGEWVLRDVPEGRSAGPAWRRNALANSLRGLGLDDVRRFAPPHPDDAARTVLVTDDGLRFTATSWREGEGEDRSAWVHFTVDEAEGAASATSESEPASEGDADRDPAESGIESAAAERLADAVAVDARLSPWAFRIPEPRADDLAPRLDDLLEPPDED